MRVHTGDLHGNMSRIIEFIQKNQGKENCYLFVHGDAGINYDLGEGDRKKKQELQKAVDEFWQKNQKECNILLIRGNHECRPENIYSYEKQMRWGGQVYVESEYPNLIFLKDGELFKIEGSQYLVLGGGYSSDYFSRMLNNEGWWPDEELSKIEWQKIIGRLEEKNQKDLDLLNLIVLSHVLPKSCEKVFTERKQTSRTEEKMDEILDRFGSSIKAWYAGHYHINEERNMSENWKGEVRIFYDCFWKE